MRLCEPGPFLSGSFLTHHFCHCECGPSLVQCELVLRIVLCNIRFLTPNRSSAQGSEEREVSVCSSQTADVKWKKNAKYRKCDDRRLDLFVLK